MLKQMPNISTRVRRSKDGKFLIHETVFTHIKPAAYYEAVIAGNAQEDDVEELAVA